MSVCCWQTLALELICMSTGQSDISRSDTEHRGGRLEGASFSRLICWCCCVDKCLIGGHFLLRQFLALSHGHCIAPYLDALSLPLQLINFCASFAAQLTVSLARILFVLRRRLVLRLTVCDTFFSVASARPERVRQVKGTRFKW